MKHIFIFIITVSVLFIAAGCNIDNYPTQHDSITGLTWTRCPLSKGGKIDKTYECAEPNGAFTWEEAIDACNKLDYDGNNYNWRLPNIRELQSIVIAYQTIKPFIDLAAFPDTEETIYWTSTSYHSWLTSGLENDEYDYAYVIDFKYGNVHAKPKDINYESGLYFRVRCVAGP